MVEVFARQQGAQDLHHLGGAGIARAAGQLLAGKVRGDDVDIESPAGACGIGPKDAVKRGDTAGQLRRPVFADAGGPEQFDPPHLGGNGGGKGGGVQPQLIARGQEDIVKAALFGA